MKVYLGGKTEVADPTSPQYGQYLSIDDLTNLPAPAEEDIDAVLAWLEKPGAAQVYAS